MKETAQASYQQFGDDDSEENPQANVFFHVAETGRWNHIEDLDNFFTRVYHYHQRHGFTCMVLQEVLEIFQFSFVVIFSIFLLNCVDYPVLFKDKTLNTTRTKVHLSDAILPTDQCVAHFSALEWTVIIAASIFWLFRLIKFVCNLFQYWDVRAFFNTALKIRDADLDNVTWHDVQKKLREVQVEQQMCIHKKELTELDIYHRILRFKNYMVAMVNKGLFPPKLYLPFIGEVYYLSYGLKFNIEFLLFWGPWSPFENSWHLKPDFKKIANKQELANKLERYILYLAFANIILSPFILLWQLFYSFFNYAEILKRDPSTLGARCWSLYGKYYLRHFNELDHELNARLSRAYRPASKYMNIFTSPLLSILATNIGFVSGACLAVLLSLSLYDEDVLTVEHVLTAITILGAILASSRAFVPDEHLVWWPEHLMNAVLAHVHYIPSHWRGNAHTQTVRNEFTHLFQYKATFLLTELISPINTPLLLLTHIRKKSVEFVDFYRNFTVEVGGVGDVCSFAQMDIRAHGNPEWVPGPNRPTTDQYTQAEEGKTELSLIHFTFTNPDWTPPEESGGFLSGIKEEARRQILQDPALSLSSDVTGMSTLLQQAGPYDSLFLQSSHYAGGRSVHTNVSRTEGPVYDRNYLHGTHWRTQGTNLGTSGFNQTHLRRPGLAPSLGASVFGNELSPADPTETTAMDMSINALYLHHAHQRGIERRGGVRQSTVAGVNAAGGERLPLLGSPSKLS